MDAGHICLRGGGANLLEDVAMQAAALGALGAAYEPFWLQLGMETVLGAPMPPPNNSSNGSTEPALREWLVARLLGDPAVARAAAPAAAVEGCARDRDAYRRDLGTAFLKKARFCSPPSHLARTTRACRVTKTIPAQTAAAVGGAAGPRGRRRARGRASGQ